MTWNYRIVKYHNVDAHGLHEVYYGDDPEKPIGMTASPCRFSCADGDPQEIIDALQMALNDAKTRPVFEAPESWCVEEWVDDYVE